MARNMVFSQKTGKNRLTGIFLVIFFTILCVIVLIPFISILLTSLKDSSMVIREGFNLRISSDTFTLENYRFLFTADHNYFRWFRNSLVLTTAQTAFTLLISAWVGYGFAFYNFRGKKLLFICVLIIMMIPFEILMLPLYQIIVSMGLVNSYIGILLPYLAHPTAIFFFRQFLRGIPKEIIDAGRIDGCSEYGIFLRLIFPLMKPALAAMAIYVGMWSWNNYLWPLLVLSDSSKFTLPIGLASLLSPYGTNYLILLPGAVLSVVPIMILFFAAQKYFIAGMSTGSVKG